MTDLELKSNLEDYFGERGVHDYLDNPPADFTDQDNAILREQLSALFGELEDDYDPPGHVPNYLFRGRLSVGVLGDWVYHEARPTTVKAARKLYLYFCDKVLTENTR